MVTYFKDSIKLIQPVSYETEYNTDNNFLNNGYSPDNNDAEGFYFSKHILGNCKTKVSQLEMHKKK